MKSKIVKITFLVLILGILGIVALNLMPGVETKLHIVTGWN